MSTKTTNLNLVKPDLTDTADITVINANMDLLDAAVASKANTSQLPTKVSQLTNDNNFINASGAPVQSINNKTGIVTLAASDVGAEPTIPTKNSAFNQNFETNASNIKMDGIASAGTLTSVAKADHIHPNDTTKANLASPTFTGTVTLPYATLSDGMLLSLNPAVVSAGTTQATAAVLTKDINIITSGTGGVQVQGATTGKVVVIVNNTASAINVYPSSGHYFDGLAVNIPIALNPYGFVEMYGYSANQWMTTQNAEVQFSQVKGKPTTLAGYGITDSASATSLTTHINDDTKHVGYATTNSSNAYSIAIPNLTTLTDGLQIRVKFNVASTGAITVNANSLGAKSVVDYFGNAVTNVRINLIANLVYESTSGNFILQGKGGGGNAISGQLLLSATATTDAGPITGTMPNNGAQNFTPSASVQTVPAGYTTGGTVAGVAVSPATVLTGNTIAGTAGTMPNNGAINVTQTTSAQVTTIPAGYHNGSGQVTNNITITSLGGKRQACGKTSFSGTVLTVTGLAFQPRMVMAWWAPNTPSCYWEVLYLSSTYATATGATADGLGGISQYVKVPDRISIGTVTSLTAVVSVTANGFTFIDTDSAHSHPYVYWAVCE